jgi:hypothetical protein
MYTAPRLSYSHFCHLKYFFFGYLRRKSSVSLGRYIVIVCLRIPWCFLRWTVTSIIWCPSCPFFIDHYEMLKWLFVIYVVKVVPPECGGCLALSASRSFISLSVPKNWGISFPVSWDIRSYCNKEAVASTKQKPEPLFLSLKRTEVWFFLSQCPAFLAGYDIFWKKMKSCHQNIISRRNNKMLPK